MLKLHLKVPVFMLIVSLSLPSCKKEEKPIQLQVGSMTPAETGHWTDEDTLQISASGTINEKYSDRPEIQRREMACSAAKLNAMGTALRILGNAETESVTDTSIRTDDNEEHFSGTIKNGSIVKKDFDASSNTCSVVFEIKETNLKKKASALKKQAQDQESTYGR